MFRTSVMLPEGNMILRSDISVFDLLEPRLFGRKSLGISVSGTSGESYLGADAYLAIIRFRNPALGRDSRLELRCDRLKKFVPVRAANIRKTHMSCGRRRCLLGGCDGSR
jgi:hypothetical protein